MGNGSIPSFTAYVLQSSILFCFDRSTIPLGLQHVLLHHGKSRREVYKYMYGQVVVSVVLLFCFRSGYKM